MRIAVSFTSLVVVGSALFAQPAEGQYPFLDPDDPCYECITVYMDVGIPANQSAAWSDPDSSFPVCLPTQRRAGQLH